MDSCIVFDPYPHGFLPLARGHQKKLPLENTKHFDVFSRATLEPRNEDAFACVYIHRIAMAYKCQISSYYVYIYIYCRCIYEHFV